MNEWRYHWLHSFYHWLHSFLTFLMFSKKTSRIVQSNGLSIVGHAKLLAYKFLCSIAVLSTNTSTVSLVCWASTNILLSWVVFAVGAHWVGLWEVTPPVLNFVGHHETIPFFLRTSRCKWWNSRNRETLTLIEGWTDIVKGGSNLFILHEFFNRSKISKYHILKVGVNRSARRWNNYSMLHECFEMSNIQVLDTPQTLNSETSNTNLTLFLVD